MTLGRGVLKPQARRRGAWRITWLPERNLILYNDFRLGVGWGRPFLRPEG
jgi:hypothetical protein